MAGRVHDRHHPHAAQRGLTTKERQHEHRKEIIQRFIHKWNGSAIQYEEIVYDADASFTIESSHPYTDDEWAAIWVSAQNNGIGASRSQDCGRFEVTRWDLQDAKPKSRKRAA